MLGVGEGVVAQLALCARAVIGWCAPSAGSSAVSPHLVPFLCGSFDSNNNIRRSGIAIKLALVSPVILLGRLVLLVGARGIDQRDQYLQIFELKRLR
jgi:hypothetical protein